MTPTPRLSTQLPILGISLLVLLVTLLALLGGSAWASDWPQWRGDERDGISSDVGLADQWPEAGPPVVWRIDDLGEGYGAVAVADGRVFVQGTRGKESMIFAHALDDGRPLWSVPLGERLVQDKGNGPRATPTVVGDEVYVLNGMGELAALRAEDGALRWQVNILERFDSSQIRWGISESPLIEGDWVVVMPGGKQGAIAALERQTGETVWTSSELTDRASYSSLIAETIGDERVIIGFTQGAGVGVRASDGKLLWRYERPANGTANAATPVYGDGYVFYSSSYGIGGGAVRVRDTGDGVEAEEAWFEPALQNHHGGVVLIDGHLYGFFGNALGCAELATGEIKWRARSVGKGSLTAADGKLFLLGENHEAGLAVATPEGYRELGRFEIEDLGQPSWAHPVVTGGKLFLRNWNTLTVYDVSKDVATTAAGAGR